MNQINSLWLLVVGMAVVTYLPRMIPLVFLKDMKLPSKIRRFLEFVPYTVLACLIFPGILTSSGSTIASLIGGATAFLLAWRGFNLVVIVLGAILAVFVAEQALLFLI